MGFWLIPCLAGMVAGIARYGQVTFAVQTGRVFGSVLTASLSLSHMCICFPCFLVSSFSFINFLTASLLFIFTYVIILPTYKNFVEIYVPNEKR